MPVLAAKSLALESIDLLFDGAKIASENAYARYSHFHVGAALLTDLGNIYTGCNVENISYPIGTCAEANAIAAACVAEGPNLRLRAIAVYAMRNGSEHAPCSPCGACRQRIVEFGPHATVHFYGLGLKRVHQTSSELLPHAFNF
jgi:cytidine deaminase